MRFFNNRYRFLYQCCTLGIRHDNLNYSISYKITQVAPSRSPTRTVYIKYRPSSLLCDHPPWFSPGERCFSQTRSTNPPRRKTRVDKFLKNASTTTHRDKLLEMFHVKH